MLNSARSSTKSTNSSTSLMEDIERFKTTYYTENRKSLFFKKSQKLDCASRISTEFDMNDLLSQTFVTIPNTNRVYIDYTVFKLYANPENYQAIVDYVIHAFRKCIETYDSFECHVNLYSFTITAAERYKTAIELFCKECLKSETRYGSKLARMYIYYSPGVIDQFTKLFSHLIDPYIRDRFVIYSKEESETKLRDVIGEL